MVCTNMNFKKCDAFKQVICDPELSVFIFLAAKDMEQCVFYSCHLLQGTDQQTLKIKKTGI